MPRKRKELGRPARPLPPRVDATAEDMAQAMFAVPADHQWKYPNAGPEGPVYRCVDCGEAVYYPDTLYRDGRCKACKKAMAG